MTVSRTSAFEQTPPKRPAEGDVLNGAKTNATATVPPNFLAAEEFEQVARLVIAAARMIPVLRISITSGTTPTIASFASARSDVSQSDITVTRNGAGDVSLTWAAGKFPSANSRPVACLNTTSIARGIAAVLITNGVRVLTRDGSDALADYDFTVQVF